MNDLVSIIMPSYNTGKYIFESIKSVQQQTYSNWELIIVDDCSTDNTDEIVKSFNDERIRYIRNIHNSGAAISRNKALKEAKGRWIAFLDSDDIWESDKLKQQIDFMENRNIAFSYTRYSLIDEMSKELLITYSGPLCIDKEKLYRINWMGCLTVMYDANVVGLIQIIDIKKRNDYALWLKVIEKTNCYLLDKTLAKYRVRKKSVSHDKFIKLLKAHYILFKEAQSESSIVALYHVFINLIFGVWKKLFYVKRG